MSFLYRFRNHIRLIPTPSVPMMVETDRVIKLDCRAGEERDRMEGMDLSKKSEEGVPAEECSGAAGKRGEVMAGGGISPVPDPEVPERPVRRRYQENMQSQRTARPVRYGFIASRKSSGHALMLR